MKLRIKGDSLRLRLSQSEVEQLGKAGLVKETTHFGNSKLVYAIELKDIEVISATYENDQITIYLPERISQEWIHTDQVGVETQLKFDDHELFILIEKDFQCLIPRKEDESDLNTNPKAKS